jgi:hypothetical protein
MSPRDLVYVGHMLDIVFAEDHRYPLRGWDQFGRTRDGEQEALQLVIPERPEGTPRMLKKGSKGVHAVLDACRNTSYRISNSWASGRNCCRDGTRITFPWNPCKPWISIGPSDSSSTSRRTSIS